MNEPNTPGIEQINAIARRLMDEVVDEAIAEGDDQFRAGKTSGILAMKIAVKELVASIYEFDGPFQPRVQPWLLACFGEMIAGDREERNHRFLEEALELVQSTGCTASEAHQLVDYVYSRPVGEPAQEVGSVMVTLAALCLANDLDMHAAAETELARIWTKVEQIRAKQAAKPKHSPLPVHVATPPAGHDDAFAAFCDREGYPSDGDIDSVLRAAFDEGLRFAASQPPADAAPVNTKPFMYAIMEPSGAPYMDEFCVASSSGDLHSTLNGLNDSPDTGYTVVPVYLAAPQQHAQAALSDDQLDEHINAILRPSGTKIANYTMQKNRDDMRAAMRAILATCQPAPIDRAAIHRKVLERGMDGPDVVGPTVCTVPPSGWYCTRAPGHDGPCAAYPVAPVAAVAQDGAAPVECLVPFEYAVHIETRKAYIAGFRTALPYTAPADAVPAQAGMQGDSRAAFEVWCNRYQGYVYKAEHEEDTSQAEMWAAWQAALAQRAASKDSERDAALALAYGILWHVNAGMDAPPECKVLNVTPERAAYEARKALRDMLTNEQRGHGIHAARERLAAMAAQQGEKGGA